MGESSGGSVRSKQRSQHPGKQLHRKSEGEESGEELRKGEREVRRSGRGPAGSPWGPLGAKGVGLFGTRCGDNWSPTWEKNDALLPYFLYQNKFQAN